MYIVHRYKKYRINLSRLKKYLLGLWDHYSLIQHWLMNLEDWRVIIQEPQSPKHTCQMQKYQSLYVMLPNKKNQYEVEILIYYIIYYYNIYLWGGSPFWCQKVTVTNDVVTTGLDVLVNDIWSDRSNLDQAIVLNKNCIASQIAMKNWRITCDVQVTID